MKKVLILCLHRPDRSPSQRFRFEQYLPYLEQQGYQFHFSYLLDAADDQIFYKPGHYLQKLRIVIQSSWKRWKETLLVKKYDLVFVQREGYMLGTAFFEKRMARKIPMIFDFDDAIWMQVVSDGNKKLSFLKNANKTRELIGASALVLAGNAYLADYALQYNKNVVIVPTTLDTDTHQPVKKNKQQEAVCIGWSGSFSTIPHFELAIPALKKIREKFGDRVYFKVYGDGRYQNKELGITGIAWSAEKELEELSEIEIGIMPLPDDEWSKGKCGFKGLLYMSMSIPAVMSPVGVNKEIVQHGINGFLPANDEEWVNVLSALIEDAAKRKLIGEAGRKTVEERYSVEAWKGKYQKLFDELLKN